MPAGAAARRRFLDTALCQLRPNYARYLEEYNRLHEHKTRILRDSEEKPSLLSMWEDFSLRMARIGAQIIRYRAYYCRRLLAAAAAVYSDIAPHEALSGVYRTVSSVSDPSRPTVALSNQDGELNTITDLIALKQNVGWMRGTTDDVGYWCETLHKSWGNLLAAPCYGVPGYPSQQDDLLGRPTPGTHWLPERWQTRFHEEYARRIVSDPAFWGEWVNAMFDFGTARGANDRYACGMVTLDRRQKKDIYYLYRTLWNRREPTLYIAERRWRVRPSAEQRIKVYSSGEDPVLLVNGDSVALTKYAEGQFRADCKLLPGENRIEARCGELRDSVALRVGTALKARDFEALRKTKGLRSKD